jgi:hypothetical protein
MRKFFIAVAVFVIFFVSMGCSSDPKAGEKGGECLSDGTCKGDLRCIEDFCVDLGAMTDYPDVDSGGKETADDENGDENSGDNPDLIDECDFSIEVQNKEDLDSIVNCRAITGDFIVEGTDLDEIVLPHLEEVWNYFDIVDNSKLKKICMPKLEATGDIFGIDFNPVLTEINLSVLSYVRGNMVVWGNDSLKTISLPNFQKADEGVYINFNESLESIDVPILESIWEFFEIDHNDSLKSVSFPTLESALVLLVARNSSLEAFDMSSLYDVQEIEIVLNAQLPTEKAEALVNQVLEKRPSLDYTICGNKDGEECDFDWDDLD